MDVVSRLGANLREVREQRKLTQGELAEKLDRLGVPLRLNLISRLEKGTRTASVPEILAIAVALDVTPNRLMLTGDAHDETIELTPTTSPTARIAWGWASGDHPLAAADDGAADRYAAAVEFVRTNRPHDDTDPDLRVGQVLARFADVAPVIDSLKQVIDDGVPPDVVMAALRIWLRNRNLPTRAANDRET